MTSSSLEIVVGANWKVDARCLSRLYAYRPEDEEFDFSPILDIIDIVINGANITSRLPEESIFYVMYELVSGLGMICEGRLEKHIVAFQEAPWELAIQCAEDGFELSFYGVGPPRDVSVHNIRVGRSRLLEVVTYSAEKLVTDLLELNDAFEGEGMVCNLRDQLDRLRRARRRDERPPRRWPAPRQIGPVQRRLGDRKLGAELQLDTAHPDLWRYQGALPSDLHSLLFRGSLHLTYWGRRRVVAQGAYLFQVVGGLVSGVERLLAALEVRAGGAVIVDSGDGAASLVTAELVNDSELLLRVTEPCGSTGRTRTTPEQLFALIFDIAEAVLKVILEINPRQSLNLCLTELSARIERQKARFFDVMRGDVYFDQVQEYLRSAPAIARPEPPVHRASMPVPMKQIRHLFLRSVWHLARNHINFRRIVLMAKDLLVPSRNRLDCLDRTSGRVRWSIPCHALLGSNTDRALVARDTDLSCVEIAAGRTTWTCDLCGIPGTVQVFHLDQRAVAVLSVSDVQLIAVDLGTGETLWRFTLEHGEMVGFCLAGLVLVVLGQDGFAYGLRPASGEVLWSVRIAGASLLPPLVHEGRLYLFAEIEPGCNGKLHSVFPLTGRPVFDKHIPAPLSCHPLVVGSIGVLPLESHRAAALVALELETGEDRWSMPLDTAHIDTPNLTHLDGQENPGLVVKTDTGHCLGIDMASGDIRWRTCLLEPGDILLSNIPPGVVDGYLVVPERMISLLNPRNGRRLHRFTDLPEHPSYLHVEGDMNLIVGEGEDHLECFDMSGFLALVT